MTDAPFDPKCLSAVYSVRPLTDEDAETVFALCRENTLYYQYCPPFVTTGSIRSDMRALPQGRTVKGKYYLGFFEAGKLIAVLDLITGYPDPKSAFFGFFMTAVPVQHRGIGSRIISDACRALKENKFHEVRLCWVEGNPQAESFWHKNGFAETGLISKTENYTVVIARRVL